MQGTLHFALLRFDRQIAEAIEILRVRWIVSHTGLMRIFGVPEFAQ